MREKRNVLQNSENKRAPGVLHGAVQLKAKPPWIMCSEGNENRGNRGPVSGKTARRVAHSAPSAFGRAPNQKVRQCRIWSFPNCSFKVSRRKKKCGSDTEFTDGSEQSSGLARHRRPRKTDTNEATSSRFDKHPIGLRPLYTATRRPR